MSETVLQEADRVINGPRKSTYGDATEEFIKFAQVWSAYKGVEITPLDYANMLILMKVMRTRHEYHRDSYVDICGYAALAEKYQDKVEADKAPATTLQPFIDAYQEIINDTADWVLPDFRWGNGDLIHPPHGAVIFDPPQDIYADAPSSTTRAYTRAYRLTKVQQDRQWQSELTLPLIYCFVDGEWWYRNPSNTAEDPWVKSCHGGDDVPECEGPFVLYSE